MTSDTHNPSRRDFLQVSALSYAGVGAAATLWPLALQMQPDAATTALASVEVDLAPIAVGQAITVLWRGKPVFIRRRTAQEIEAERQVPVAGLIDKAARAAGRPDDARATDANRTKPDAEEWVVVVGVCTHLGCVPQGQRLTEGRGAWGGWFCSCHGSQYDTSGRVRKGPAPSNLEVPPFYFMTPARIEIGRLSREAGLS